MFRLVLAVIATTVFGLLAVAEQLTTIRAGYQIDKERRALDGLREERRQLELVVGRLSTPEALQSRAAAFRFDLAIPDRPRVVRVRPRTLAEHDYARFDPSTSRTAARNR
ncbi:MAG: hypothetical protein AAB434_13435 [Planctomycetota bacterium]